MRSTETVGRPSIAPERLAAGLQLRMLLHTIRSERMLARAAPRQPAAARWFVGLGMSEEVWHATVFTQRTGTGCWRGRSAAVLMAGSCGRRSSRG